ncbi:MAG: biotin transporter BioY [Oscillospiraceae bacterium]|nr:biotin transporter BioY [Oscillospiraceae bacterium]
MNKIKFSTRNICLIGIFAAVIAVMAQISFPLPGGIPVTLQTFAIMLAGIVLGARKGAVAVLVYVLLGAVGAPVFAGFGGGLGIIVGRTGGFIVTFPLLALCAGIGEGMYSRGRAIGKVWLFSWLAVGVLVNYLFGLLWFSHITSFDLLTSLSYCIVPFIPGDALKLILAAVAGRQLKTALLKGKVIV